MALPLELFGKEYEPLDFTIGSDGALAYAAATNDPNEAYASGRLAPPVFTVVLAYGSLVAPMLEVVPPDNLLTLVHGEQDIHLHRPLLPGMTLTSVASPFAARVGGSGTRLTMRVRSTDEAGALVVEQYFTLFLRGLTEGEDVGPDKPDHDFPEEARGRPLGSHVVHVDDDQTFRYRDASGDANPIHVDVEFARSVGLPGIILHGLCTMAMTSQGVIRVAADGDPARLRRLAVRFAANVLPGNDIETSLFDAGERDGRRLVAFEATSADATVIKNGWAEIDAPRPG